MLHEPQQTRGHHCQYHQVDGMESSFFARCGRAGPEHTLSGTEVHHYRCVPTTAPESNQNICNTAGTSLHKEHSGLSTTHVLGVEGLEALVLGIGA